MPIVKRTYGGSWNAAHSIRGPEFRGGRRGRRSRFIIMVNKSIMNPEQLTAHGNPSHEISVSRYLGQRLSLIVFFEKKKQR